jgi:tetratricopeptide (TPR) repeat protein
VQLGKYDLAIQDYTKALEVDPANSFAYYNRGITKDRMGDFEGAVADFSSAITLDPGNADFYHNRGFSLRKQVRQLAAGQHSCSCSARSSNLMGGLRVPAKSLVPVPARLRPWSWHAACLASSCGVDYLC